MRTIKKISETTVENERVKYKIIAEITKEIISVKIRACITL